MTLYEMNQSIYAQCPKMSSKEIEEATKDIQSFLEKHPSNYYMMLNVDGRYYTLYTYKQEQKSEKMAKEMVKVAKTLGVLKSVEILDDMVEFWIQQDKVCSMYAMFDYTQGVIKV